MNLNRKFQALFFILLSLAACKKTEQPKPSQTPASKPSKDKSIEVVSGNNQYGYTGKPLADTIVIKVALNSPADSATSTYYATYNSAAGQFLVVGRTISNGNLYYKAIWSPAGTTATPSMTFYTFSGCTVNQISQGTCQTLDSVKISATIRKPWVSVFNGNQGGLNVLYDLHFTDPNHALASGEGSGIVRTTDGGKTWTGGPPARSDNDMQLMAFSSPDTGLMVIVNNYAMFTYDGGQTYTQENWTPPFTGDHSSSAYLMRSRNVIYTVGVRGQIAKTTDGGLTWTQAGFNFLNNFYGITAVGPDTLYACGDIGKIVKTTDGGKTWSQQPVQLNNYLNIIYFITNNFGFAGGQYGALIRTTDGGAGWTTIPTGLLFPVIAIRFFSSQHGYIVTSGGEIAESKDGGLTWIRRNPDNYGVGSLNKAVIKDETTIFGLQQASIYTYDLTQP